ncbi:hypothetical protein A9K97_gp357 [Tokyovirus A1]|uniref:hypothetical protein n=1 Tax=Tokyovirus A1 TaxID=1826170 RepID=UPI0007A97300|nr:hypothetical protein A9K97_gp357 [Tokyovirus A1]BAU79994.1 hypothetical protein [Tokyovirus A1]
MQDDAILRRLKVVPFESFLSSRNGANASETKIRAYIEVVMESALARLVCPYFDESALHQQIPKADERSASPHEYAETARRFVIPLDEIERENSHGAHSQKKEEVCKEETLCELARKQKFEQQRKQRFLRDQRRKR